jgi:hypothetical protein
MIDRPDGTARRREYAVRVLMGEPPLRAAARAIPLRERDNHQRRRRVTREFLRKWCIGCGGWRS